MASAAPRFPDPMIYIGKPRENFNERKLPTVRETMQLFFYHHTLLKITVRESAWIVAGEVVRFWTEKSRIPAIEAVHVFEKIIKFHEKWLKLKKNHARLSDAQINREMKFEEKLDSLFDIATSNALETIIVEEDKQFLIAQRLPGRIDTMLSRKDAKLAQEEKELAAKQARTEKRRERQRKFKEKYAWKHQSQGISRWDSETSDDNVTANADAVSPRKRARKNILTRELSATCDSLGISSRGASQIFSATLHSAGLDIGGFNVNKSSFNRSRGKNRLQTAEQIKEDFSPDTCPCLTLHWDGKIVPDLVGKKKVDLIAVVVTRVNTEKLLSVPKIDIGTGAATANVVFRAVEEWNIVPNIKAFAFDTTSVNTGLVNGAAVILQELLGHEVLRLACRHHILELLLEAVYVYHLKPSGGPEILLFKRFQQAWPTLDKTSYSTGVNDPYVTASINESVMTDIIQFATEHIQMNQPRDDYLELLSLSIIFAGGVPPSGVKFMAPGAFNKTRWMGKAIYSLKIYMLRDQFHLTRQEEKGLRQINMFVVSVYLKYWFFAPDSIGAPKNDLDLIADLRMEIYRWKSIDSPASTIALHKLSGHLWYLSEYLVPLASFDERVSPELKKKCVVNLKNIEGIPEPPYRLPVLAKECGSLDSLLTMNSRKFFDFLNLPCGFLDEDPSTWNANSEYEEAKKVARHPWVVNDHAERAVKLMQTFNRKITNKEEGFQALLQVSSKFQSVMKKGTKKPRSEQFDLLKK